MTNENIDYTSKSATLQEIVKELVEYLCKSFFVKYKFLHEFLVNLLRNIIKNLKYFTVVSKYVTEVQINFSL